MKIIIDGYNVLGVAPKRYTDHNQFRDWLVQRFAAYARKRKIVLVVVFDGGPYIWPTRFQHSRLVELFFTGKEQSADTFIEEFLQKHQNEDIMLVTSDREICAVAQRLNKPFMSSRHFYNLVEEAIGSVAKDKVEAGSIKRTSQNSDAAIDALMEEAASLQHAQKDDDQATSRLRASTKMSKQERKLLAKIKKL